MQFPFPFKVEVDPYDIKRWDFLPFSYLFESFRKQAFKARWFPMRRVLRFVIRANLWKAGRRLTHESLFEIAWTVIPSVILIFLAIPSLKLLYSLDFVVYDYEPILTVKVVGHQWYWSYEYEFFNYVNTLTETVSFDSYMIAEEELSPIGLRLLEVDNPLFLPAHTYIRFLVTSVDVLHSWAVPSLGIKVDAVPGRLNQIFTFIKRPGEFYGQCSEICGVNHGFMPIRILTLF